jgi:hypothetical protein
MHGLSSTLDAVQRSVRLTPFACLSELSTWATVLSSAHDRMVAWCALQRYLPIYQTIYIYLSIYHLPSTRNLRALRVPGQQYW